MTRNRASGRLMGEPLTRLYHCRPFLEQPHAVPRLPFRAGSLKVPRAQQRPHFPHDPIEPIESPRYTPRTPYTSIKSAYTRTGRTCDDFVRLTAYTLHNKPRSSSTLPPQVYFFLIFCFLFAMAQIANDTVMLACFATSGPFYYHLIYFSFLGEAKNNKGRKSVIVPPLKRALSARSG